MLSAVHLARQNGVGVGQWHLEREDLATLDRHLDLGELGTDATPAAAEAAAAGSRGLGLVVLRYDGARELGLLDLVLSGQVRLRALLLHYAEGDASRGDGHA